VNPKEPTMNLPAVIQAQDVLDYLAAHPDFFSSHPQVLAEINVPHPQLGQAISLVERQAMILRERIKVMELKLAELLRHGQENDAIAKSVQRWVRDLFLHHDTATLPVFLTESIARIFSVPQVAIAIWKPAPEFASASWVTASSAPYVEQIDQLKTPMCGPANLSLAASLFSEPNEIKSMAILPLRAGAAPGAFGVVLLGSDDLQRFSSSLGVAFLEQISELASAALSLCAAPATD
jgi:uncharacterized protein YigA (DUF484 family)